MMSDFTVQNEGTIYILTPQTRAAEEWCDELLPDDSPRWGARGYVVEHRYIETIVDGIRGDGLTIS